MTRFRVGSATDVGRVRSNNQDSKLVADHLYAVADGMGGHQGGEVASAMAVEVLGKDQIGRSLPELKERVRLANRTIFEKAGTDDGLRGMGTTLCAIALVDGLDGEEVAWVNVGDSRIYLFRDDDLLQLSADHSLVEDLVRDGQLTPEEAAVHPQRNILTRALGIDLDVDVDGSTVIPFTGDRYLLCSDGLFNEVDANRMAGVLRRLSDPDEAAAELVRLANEHGGRDNITVVIVEVTDDDGAAKTASDAIAQDTTTLEAVPIPPADESHPPAMGDRRSSLPAAGDHHDLGSEVDDLYGDLHGARVRHLTWRVVGFVLILLVVVAAAVAAVGWQARHTYFVGFADDEVTIFKGHPGGVLWFDPTVEQRMKISRSQVPDALEASIAAGKEEPSVTAARNYVLNLRNQIAQIEAAKTTTTTTTTTAPTTTTTTTVPPTTTTAPALPSAPAG
ncbi:MAG TPA: Stp1/IreP family PP2C-type Ser/Thr phosphatase [Acidimicrobiales bacterium]